MDSNRIIENVKLRNALLADLIEKYIWEFEFRTNEFYVSPYWNRFLGYESAEVKGSRNFWLSVIHPKDIQILKKKIHECKQKIVDIFSAEYRVKAKNGTYKWILSEAKIHYDERGNPLFMIGYNLNLSDLKEKEDTNRKFHTLFNNISDAVFILSSGKKKKAGSIIEVNLNAVKLTGFEREELLNRNIFDISPVDFQTESIDIEREVLEKGECFFNAVIVSKDNRKIPVEVNSTEVELDENILHIAVVRDISERINGQKRILEEKEKLLENTLEYDRIKTEFFSNISHELRTPLNIILSSIQLLNSVYIDKDIDPKKFCSTYEKHIGAMKQNSYRLLKLINNLIDITKIDAGFIKTELRNQNIVDTIENISMSAVPYLESKGISLVFDTDIEEKIIAFDEDKVERIILNLLSNAAKFTDPGDAICVIIKDKGDSVNIIIKDTGHGIPEDKVNIIFDRFRQVDALFTRRAEGSGIGLSLVKYLVESHKGSICVNSILGRGSEFIITFPSKIVDSNIELYKSKHEIRDNESKIELINIEFSDIYK